MATNRCIYLLVLLAWAVSGWSQCVTRWEETPLVSDRFIDAFQYGSFIVYVNEHGLVYFDREDPSGAPLHVQALSGKLSRVRLAGDSVLVIAEGTGIYLLKFGASDQIAVLQSFYPIDNLETAVLHGDHLFAGANGKVTMYRLSDIRTQVFKELTVVDTLDIPAVQLESDERRVYIYRQDSGITVAAYNADGYITPTQNLNVAGQDTFFGMLFHRNHLVVEMADGVASLTFEIDARLTSTNYYYRRQGSKILYDAAISDDYLFLRFEDQLEIFLINANGSSVNRTDILPLPFEDIGITRMVTHLNHLFLVNLSSQARDWSASAYSAENGLLMLVGDVSERFEDLSGAAFLHRKLYLAADNTLYLANELSTAQFTKNLPVAATFEGVIQHVIGSQDLLMVVTSIPRSPFMRVFLFDATGDTLNQVYTRDFRGTIQQVSQHDDAFSFVSFQRTTSADEYAANVIFLTERFGYQFRDINRAVPLQGASPFRDPHLSEEGLVFHDGVTLEIHSNLESLGVVRALALPTASEVQKVVSEQNSFWIETADGLIIADEVAGELNVEGRYPHWFDLSHLNSHTIAVRNRQDRVPSRYHVLSRGDNNIVSALLHFTTATPPSFLAAVGSGLVVSEKTALNRYDFDCPTQSVTYLLPYRPSLELDMSAPLAEGNLATLTVYDENNRVIGFQHLTADVIDNFNGRKLEDWLYDYDHNQTPFTAVLSSSQPMAPVISGLANEGVVESRFAFEMDIWNGEALYLPHIPKNRDLWNTNVFLRNVDESNDPVVRFHSASGSESTYRLSPGDTEVLDVDEIFKNELTPWARVTSENLNTSIHGFGLFLNGNIQQAAAVGLVGDLSDYLIVPFLAGREDPNGWTGLVLANPNDTAIAVRTIGYNPDGELIHDERIDIPAANSLVVLAEDWLREPLENDQIQWIALASDLPLMGMVLYGNGATAQLSGMPLKSSASRELVLPGVRQNDDWWTRFVLTNIDRPAANVTLTASNGFGEEVAKATVALKGKENIEFVLSDLFPDLNDAELATIQSLHAVSNFNLSGLVFRGRLSTNSMEAYNAENR